MVQTKVEYVFRGTSLGFNGGTRAMELPATFTTRNPAKAVMFAIVALRHSLKAVIYFAKVSNLDDVKKLMPNRLSNEEEEIIFEIAPADFVKRCEGYVTLQIAQEALLKLGIETHLNVGNESLTRHCREMEKMNNPEINKFVRLIQPNKK